MKIIMINDWQIVEVKTTKSTNDDALSFVLPKIGNKKFGFCAEKQTAGRGKPGKKWESGEGNLMFSLIVPCKNKDMGRLSIAVGISVLKTIEGINNYADLKLKWPNDVFLNDKKVCGILIERKDEKYAVVGVGVNIKNAPLLKDCHYQAVSLQECDIKAEKKDFLSRFLKIFEVWLERIEKKEFNALIETWIKYAKGINKKVKIRNIKGNMTGRLIGIDEKGALVLEKDGRQQTVLSGEVYYL